METIEQFHEHLDKMAQDKKALDSLQLEEERAVLAVREERGPAISALREKLKTDNAAASKFVRKWKKKLFGETKSAESALAEYGLRRTSRINALNREWSDEKTIEACGRLGLEECIKTKVSFNKEAAESLDDEELASIGRRRSFSESFWFQPKTGSDSKQSDRSSAKK